MKVTMSILRTGDTRSPATHQRRCCRKLPVEPHNGKANILHQDLLQTFTYMDLCSQSCLHRRRHSSISAGWDTSSSLCCCRNRRWRKQTFEEVDSMLVFLGDYIFYLFCFPIFLHFISVLRHCPIITDSAFLTVTSQVIPFQA